MNKKNVNTLLLRYTDILKNNQPLFEGVPEECTKTEMTEILNEFKDNIKNYEKEDVCRYIGFANGVMNFESPLVSVHINTAASIKNLIKNTLAQLSEHSDIEFREPELVVDGIENAETDSKEIYADCHYVSFNTYMILMLLEYTHKAFNAGGIKALEIQYVLGYIQGILALFSLIKMKEEKEFLKSLS